MSNKIHNTDVLGTDLQMEQEKQLQELIVAMENTLYFAMIQDSYNRITIELPNQA